MENELTPPPPHLASREAFLAHARSPRKGVLWYHRAGVLAAACRPRGDRYDRRAWVPRLARDSGLSATMVYNCVKFARQFSPGEARRLARAGLTWDKACQLMAIRDPESRAAAIRQAVRADVSVRAFWLWAGDEVGCKKPRGGRRPEPLAAHAPAVHLRLLVKDVRLLRQHHDATQEVLAAALGASTDVGQVTPEFAADLATTADELPELLCQLTAIAEVVDEYLRRLDRP